jgi:AraC family transcriptional regulator of adaptative response / DNA-3-methyladenine glycosylase II
MDRWISATLRLADVRDLAPAVARCRRLLDLDADPVAVDATLGADPALSAVVRAEPGIRVPRAVDGFETAVRAIVGQQVSVAGARTTLGHLLRAAETPADPEGSPDPDASADTGELRSFPTAAQVAALPDAAFRMPAARRESLRALAQAVVDERLDLEPGADRAEATARLTALPGVGPWTAGYVAMRAIGDPDVFLHTDLAARRGARALGLPDTPTALHEHADRWRPWRSYALIRIWRSA